MPWMETRAMDERMRMVMDWEQGMYEMSELCARYGVSRKTGYKWVGRFVEEGAEGLKDRSRMPHTCRHRMGEDVQAAILEGRRQHPHWGPRKLVAWLARRRPELRLPAASSVGALLKREGLIPAARRRSRWKHPGRPVGGAVVANDLWTADYKGQFRTQDGRYCYPLTIADLHSRYLLRCEGLSSVRTEEALPVWVQLFREVGLPRAIRTDNGAPFVSSNGIHGLCTLNTWWIRLGITHQRIEPSHPEQNGCHERMHRTLKAETTRPPAVTLQAQQAAFDRFRHEYNTERPHEALHGHPPAQVWTPSPRPFPATIPVPEYPGHFLVRFVSNCGTFRFKGRQLFISNALKQNYIGLEEVDDDLWSVYFYDVLLARFDGRTRTLCA